MPRLFTAIELPDPVRDEIHRLHQPIPGARWIAKDDYHLTLRFIGDVDGRTAREFAEEVARIDCATFQLQLSGLGAFGGNDPHNVWVGVVPSPELDALARAHDRAARNVGIKPDKHPYRPHVTLARLKNTRPDAVARYFNRFGGYRSQPFFVSRTVLMSSRPSIGGGPYGIDDVFLMRDAAAYGGGQSDLGW